MNRGVRAGISSRGSKGGDGGGMRCGNYLTSSSNIPFQIPLLDVDAVFPSRCTLHSYIHSCGAWWIPLGLVSTSFTASTGCNLKMSTVEHVKASSESGQSFIGLKIACTQDSNKLIRWTSKEKEMRWLCMQCKLFQFDRRQDLQQVELQICP